MIEKRSVARVRVGLKASPQLEKELGSLFEQPPSGGIQLHTVDERYLDLAGYQNNQYTEHLRVATQRLGKLAHSSLRLTGLIKIVDDRYGPQLHFAPHDADARQFAAIEEIMGEIPSLMRTEPSGLLYMQIGRKALVRSDRRSMASKVVDNLKAPTKLQGISVRNPQPSVTELHNFPLQDPAEFPVT